MIHEALDQPQANYDEQGRAIPPKLKEGDATWEARFLDPLSSPRSTAQVSWQETKTRRIDRRRQHDIFPLPAQCSATGSCSKRHASLNPGRLFGFR